MTEMGFYCDSMARNMVISLDLVVIHGGFKQQTWRDSLVTGGFKHVDQPYAMSSPD